MDKRQIKTMNQRDELPSASTAALRLSELRSALAEGWEIVQPIFARPLWSSLNDTVMAFNFVLRRERHVRLITIPRDHDVEDFIGEQHLAVDGA